MLVSNLLAYFSPLMEWTGMQSILPLSALQVCLLVLLAMAEVGEPMGGLWDFVEFSQWKLNYKLYMLFIRYCYVRVLCCKRLFMFKLPLYHLYRKKFFTALHWKEQNVHGCERWFSNMCWSEVVVRTPLERGCHLSRKIFISFIE